MSLWNTLSVPLKNGWQCTLIPGPQYASSAERKNRLSQLANDRADFAYYFDPNWDLRTITGANALSAIQTFVCEAMNVVHWNQPGDNAAVRNVLCEAVSTGMLVPVINREYSGLPEVTRPDPAPESWPAPGGTGDRGLESTIMSYEQIRAFQPVRAQSQGLDSLTGMAGLSSEVSSPPDFAVPAKVNDDFDLSDVIESAASAALGIEFDADGKSADDVSESTTHFGGAQPFKYTPDAVSDDVEELAASTNNPDYAARMLGYDRKTFGKMIHAMKDENDLRGDDNVIWHDNGDVYFDGQKIDNMHSY